MKKSTDTLTLMDIPPFPLQSQTNKAIRSTPALTWYALAFFLCILLLATPLARMAGTALQYTLPTSALVVLPGAWLPIRLPFFGSGRNAELATHLLFFILILTLSFLIYYASARALWRNKMLSIFPSHLRLILLTAFICGLVFVFTPAMLSRDVFAYSSYGRTMVLYHANPYFTLFSHFHQDPFYKLDDWKKTPSAYGPVWLAISALFAWLCGDQPLNSLLAYQFLGLGLHLLNTLLVFFTLRKLKQPSHLVEMGTLLYAWNPLLLLESCLSGHNDILLITFFLLSLYFSARLDQSSQRPLSLFSYLLPLTTLSLAVLIKFTAAPMLVLFLALIGRRSFLHSRSSSPIRSTLLTLSLASLFSLSLILLCYAPFWIGRHLSDIVNSFTTTPAASSAYGSILRALQEWVKAYGLPQSGPFAFFFSFFLQRAVWNVITLLLFGSALLLGLVWLWRSPTTPMLALATLASLAALLLFTPWFFPWYITWLVPLVSLALCVRPSRLQRAFLGSTLIFSASCCCIYLFKNSIPPFGGWIGFACLTTILPPLLTFFLILSFPSRRRSQNDT